MLCAKCPGLEIWLHHFEPIALFPKKRYHFSERTDRIYPKHAILEGSSRFSFCHQCLSIARWRRPISQATGIVFPGHKETPNKERTRTEPQDIDSVVSPFTPLNVLLRMAVLAPLTPLPSDRLESLCCHGSTFCQFFVYSDVACPAD
jgi:hypothetical protein